MPKQKELTGLEKPSNPEIEEAAEHYRTVRDKRMKLTEQEVTAKVNLLQVLLANEKDLSPGEDGTKVYTYDDELVVLKPGKAVVKVKTIHDGGNDEDDD